MRMRRGRRGRFSKRRGRRSGRGKKLRGKKSGMLISRGGIRL